MFGKMVKEIHPLLFFAPSTSKFRQKKQKCKKQKAKTQKKSKNATKKQKYKKSWKCTFDFKINAKKSINKKNAENTFSISKFIQKNIKNGKKKVFLHFTPKNSYKKKDKNAKKSIQNFSNCKNKHAKNNILKKMQKKAGDALTVPLNPSLDFYFWCS